MNTNALYYGDNLVWLRDHQYFPDESVDLIYLDPPFNSKADYNVLFNEPGKGGKSQAQIQAFDDTWDWSSEASEIALNELAKNRPSTAEFISWLSRQGKIQESMAAYLSMMAVRLVELHRVLKPSGSLYLHCDPTASHYLKLVIDQIFGAKNFRNEIVWCYRAGGVPRKGYPSKHDTLFFYTKGRDFTFNHEYVPYTEGTLKRGLTKVKGKYFDKGLRPEGTPIQDWWSDIQKVLSPTAKEMLGYPTQKPVALLERIIKLSSNEGDIVLDPFCGCGTTIDAAQKLNRRWLGIDVTWLAIDLVEKRLKDTYGAKITSTYEVHGKPYDMASAEALANKSKKEFEIWAISLVGAHPREHDGGVDGIFGFVEQDKKTRTIIVQVKGGDVLNPGMVRDLIGTVKKEGAAIGLLITLKEPSGGMKSLAVHSEPYQSELYVKEYPSIQIRTVAELLEGKTFDLPPTQSLFKKAQLAKEKAQQSQVF
ncbi:MAG: restriction endonuclease [Chloroflexi bacterium]|nr:restriction endonuclease [Chloroflexota bacterium]